MKDGDTIVVLTDRTEIDIRLDGIDSPELGQDFGRRAKQATSDLVFGKDVLVVPTTTDRYGRTVARVIVGSTDVSLELVAKGMAWHFRKYSSDAALREAEETARRLARGLWVDKLAEPPWQFRSGQHAQSESDRPLGLLSLEGTEPAYRGNTRSKVFHKPTCRSFKCPNCTEEFATREAAIAAGYRPCGLCKP